MKIGVNDAKRVPCARNPSMHGHHPENEVCGICGDAPWDGYTGGPSDFYVNRTTGGVYDAKVWPLLRTDTEYTPLSCVLAYTELAEKMCGCASSMAKCSFYRGPGQDTRRLCSWPQLAGKDDWYRV